MNIALRDQVEDVITGFKGTVIARSEWLNGCVQYAVKPRVNKEGEELDAQWIDSAQLKITKAFKGASSVSRSVGGPMKDAPGC
jgi:hypothetical protein